MIGELAERGLKVGYRSVWTFMHAEGPSYKKAVIAREQDRPDIVPRGEASHPPANSWYGMKLSGIN